MAEIQVWLASKSTYQMFIQHQFMPDIVLDTEDIRVNLEI